MGSGNPRCCGCPVDCGDPMGCAGAMCSQNPMAIPWVVALLVEIFRAPAIRWVAPIPGIPWGMAIPLIGVSTGCRDLVE